MDKNKVLTLCYLNPISSRMIAFRLEFDTTSVLMQQNAAMVMTRHLQQHLRKGITHPY